MARHVLAEILADDDENIEVIERRRFRDLLNPFEGLDDRKLYNRYRFPSHIILELTDLLRDELDHASRRSRALPALHQVCIALRYLASNSFQAVIGDTLGVNQGTACRCLHRFMKALVRHVNSFIKFPSDANAEAIKEAFYNVAQFPNVVGAVDGTHVPILPPGQNKDVYRNRKGFYSINVQAVCDANGLLLHLYANWPGSAHDSRVMRESVLPQLMNNLNDENWLLGDSGYACSQNLLTPILDPANNRERQYNRAHRKTRVIIEQFYGRWKRRFRILYRDMRLKSPVTCSLAIMCCGMLHNLAVQRQLPDIDDERADIVINRQRVDNPANAAPNAAGVRFREHVVQRFF